MGVLISACAPTPVRSTYSVFVPKLKAAPVYQECQFTGKDGVILTETCAKLLKSDLELIIRELKGACIANGQTDEECQIEATEN